MSERTYECPGRDLPSLASDTFAGYVACYRAGHPCPPKEAIQRTDEHGTQTTLRCPCCGDFGGSMFIPAEWTTHPTSPSAQCRGEGRGGAVSERGAGA